MFSLNCVWINVWVNNREAGELSAHYAVKVIIPELFQGIEQDGTINFIQVPGYVESVTLTFT